MNDPFIDALRAEQQKVAVEALKRPRAGDGRSMEYEYGVVVGTYAGLELAIQRILKLYRDEKEDSLE